MPKAARLADSCAGHGCFPATPIIAGSGDVSINGKPAARKGDAVLLHACPCPNMPHGIHARSISAGSSNVSINGKPAARVGDAIGCGGSVAAGSGDVLIGDTPYQSPSHECGKAGVLANSPFLKISPMAEPTEAVWSEAQVMVDELAAKSEQQKKAPPTSTVVEKFADNEAVWTLDEKGRPLSVEATLKSTQKTERSKEEVKAQGSVGGSSRLEDDDGGHLIGHRFMSDQGLKNLFPQNANLNRSAYKKMENELADWTQEGCQVKLKVLLSPPGAERPKEITAYYEAKNPDTGKIVFRRRHNFNNMSGESFERVKRKDMKYYKG